MLRALAIIAAGALASESYAVGPEATDEALTSHIPRMRVESSGIKSVGFSKRRHILEIEFSTGGVYRYLNVPPSVYRDLISAESKTRYYHQNIKRNYQSQRVRPRVKDQPKN